MREPRRSQSRRDLHCIVADGVSFSFMVGVGESFVPAFVVAAGHGDIAAGLVATLPMLVGAVFQLLTPLGVSWLGSHKRWVVGCALLQAASFLPLVGGALAGEIERVWIFVAASIYWGFGMATGPAWNTWVGTLVPQPLRARFFARRSMWSHVALMIGVCAGGGWLHAGIAVGSPLSTFALPFAAAAAARLVSARYLARQSEPNPHAWFEHQRLGLLEFLDRLRSRPEGQLMGFLLALQAAVHVAAPFFTPYMLGPLGFSYWTFTLFTMTPFVARVLVLPVFGSLAHRWGTHRVLWLGTLGIVPLPTLWLLSHDIGFLLGVQVLAGASWAAFELAVLLTFFERIPESERTSMLTFYNLANALAAVGGTVFAGLLFQALGSAALAYPALFLVSAIARLACVGLLRRVPAMDAPVEGLALRPLAVRPSAGVVERPILPGVQTRAEDPNAARDSD